MSKLSSQILQAVTEDGKDHIRVGITGKTKLGRILAQNHNHEFYVPNVGTFLSATCFANWLHTGVDEHRMDRMYRPKGLIRNYRSYVLFAKFFQLCKIRPKFSEEISELPFFSYRVHTTGIVESDRWAEYPTKVKEMLKHINDPALGVKVPFPFDSRAVEAINLRIKEIASQYKLEPDAPTERPEHEAVKTDPSTEVEDSVETTEELLTENSEVELETVEEVNLPEGELETVEEVTDKAPTLGDNEVLQSLLNSNKEDASEDEKV